jgi:hypothetical protein
VLRNLASSLKRTTLLLLIGLLSLAAVLVPASVSTLSSQARVESTVEAGSKTFELAPDAKPTGITVTVGMQVQNIYDLNLADQSFLADGWYWLNWGDDVQAALDKLKIEPGQIVEFANEIEPAQYSQAEILPEKIKLQPDAPHSLYVKFSGKFYINDVAQRLAPFDQQHLELKMEVKPSSLSEGTNRINLIPVTVKQMPIAGEFTNLSGFILTYSPDPVTVFLKWLLPLIVVMGIVILAPSIDGTLGDVRLAIPSAALLTLVVLHDGYKANFPPAPYLTYLDELYTYSYIVCFAIFLLFLVGTNAHKRSSAADQERVNRWVKQLDAVVQVGTVVGFLLVASVGYFT